MAARDRPDITTLVLLRRVRDRMDRDFARPLDVPTLARSVHLSPGHLSRQFKLAYGETPYSYLMTRRIERAMSLLRLGDMTVTEVCFAVGCQSLGTFSTRFTELVGVPPSVYRDHGASPLPGMLPCIVRQLSRPVRRGASPLPSTLPRAASSESIRNREAPAAPAPLR